MRRWVLKTPVHLQHLPVDILKIDRSFVSEVDRGPERQAMVTAFLASVTVYLNSSDPSTSLRVLDFSGLTTQSSFTVRTNVLLGKPEDGLMDAVDRAMLGPDLAAFPDGLETMVGARGVRLSGGREAFMVATSLLQGPLPSSRSV